MKPGKSPNISNPMPSMGVRAATAVGRMSSQTPQTAQTAGGPERLCPPHRPPYPHGEATIDRNGVEADQTENYTKSTKKTYQDRAKAFGI